MKDVQATGEAFTSLNRERPALQNMTFLKLFSLVSIFVGNFCPPGIPNHIPNEIRIQPTKIIADPYYSTVVRTHLDDV
jgi:hypothetical protein